jgi:uncharacterized protein (TIGR03067 family)
MHTLLVIVVLALLGCQTPAARTTQHHSHVQGTWTVVSAERNGQPTDDLRGQRLIFAGDTFVIQRGGQTLYRGTFTTDPARTPAHIDFRHTEGALAGTTWRGVYALERDTLRIADNAPDVAKPRPTTLAAKAGSGHLLVGLERAAR